MSRGIAGALARIDLSSGRVVEQPTTDYAKYVGGAGIAAKIVFDEVAREVDPFDPANPLILITGPMTGTPAPASGTTFFYSKSPVGYPVPVCRPSAMGGELGAELKYAGFDGLVIEGRADRPVYLWIKDGSVGIADAGDLWGLDTFETQALLQRRHGSRTQVASIGPSGERLGRMAAIVHKTGHASGISGFGAVMGSKNLKAIAVRGTGSIAVARPKELIELARAATALIYDPENPPRATGMKGMQSIPGEEEFIARYGTGSLACHGCPIACLAVIDVPGVPLGADCCTWPYGLRNPETGMPTGFEPDERGWRNTWELNVEVNRLGMSVWESMELFRFLISLRDAGLVNEKDTGLPLHGDQRELWLALLHQIAYREGIGDVLTEQLPRAAEQIGRGSEGLFLQTKGWAINLPWDDPRVHPMHAMLSSTGTYLAHAEPWFLWAVYAGELHLPKKDSRHLLSSDEIADVSRRVFGSETAVDPGTFEGKAELAIHSQNYRMLGDALPFCRLAMHYDLDYHREDMVGDRSLLARLYSAVTGDETDERGLVSLGERLFNLDRAQGIKQGYRSRADDVTALDKRVFSEPHEFSPMPGGIVQADALLAELDRYYALRGWDPETGIPTPARLEQLDLREESGALHELRERAKTQGGATGPESALETD